MRLAALLCLAIVATLNPSGPRSQVDRYKKGYLSIDREVSVDFTQDQATTILQQGLSVLSKIDIPGHDVATNIPLHFNGRIGTFSHQKGIIDTCKDLDKLYG